jgi:hypothetical protein
MHTYFLTHDCVYSKCDRGKWICPDTVCASQCTVLGNQHFETFDNFRYNFQGANCKYTLLQVSAPLCAMLLYIMIVLCHVKLYAAL